MPSRVACWSLTNSTSARISHERITTAKARARRVLSEHRSEPCAVDGQHRRKRIGLGQQRGVLDERRRHRIARRIAQRNEQHIHQAGLQDLSQQRAHCRTGIAVFNWIESCMFTSLFHRKTQRTLRFSIEAILAFFVSWRFKLKRPELFGRAGLWRVVSR